LEGKKGVSLIARKEWLRRGHEDSTYKWVRMVGDEIN
jgi:hypothetical protein